MKRTPPLGQASPGPRVSEADGKGAGAWAGAPPAAAHLGQRSVVPGLQEVVGDGEGLPVGADGRRQRHRPPRGVGEAPGVGEALGDVTENGGFEGHAQGHRLGPPHLRGRKVSC